MSKCREAEGQLQKQIPVGTFSRTPSNIFISDHSLFILQQLFSWTGGGSGWNSSKITLSNYRGLTFLELKLVLPTEHPLAGKSLRGLEILEPRAAYCASTSMPTQLENKEEEAQHASN